MLAEKTTKQNIGLVKHMSSASLCGQLLGLPGRYVEEYKEMDGILCPKAGENLDIVLRSKID